MDGTGQRGHKTRFAYTRHILDKYMSLCQQCQHHQLHGGALADDDSLNIVGFAQMMSDLLSKAAPGAVVPEIKVPGQLYTWRGEKFQDKRLDKLKKKVNILIFYTEGCEVCAAQKAAALALLRGDVVPEKAGVVGKDSHIQLERVLLNMITF